MAITAISHVVPLDRETDVYIACERGAHLAEDAGFDRYACADIETAMSEICGNVIRHADGGWVAIRILGSMFEVAATDRGPGFDAPRRSSPGLGIGLEGARRLMGKLSITRLADGSRVTMSRALPNTERPDTPTSPWSTAAVFRTKTGQVACGDATSVVESPDGSLRVALADGLGTGDKAAVASQRVLEAMGRTIHTSPSSSLTEADRAATNTRGAAVAAVHLRDDGRGVHAAVGDVSCQITSSDERFVSRPGIVGAGAQASADTPFRLPDDAAVILWTDGIRALPRERRRHLPPVGSELGWMEEAVVDGGDPADDGALVMVRRGR